MVQSTCHCFNPVVFHIAWDAFLNHLEHDGYLTFVEYIERSLLVKRNGMWTARWLFSTDALQTPYDIAKNAWRHRTPRVRE